MPLILALGRQGQVDLCEFKASLVYKESSRTARAVTERNPVLKNKNKTDIILTQKNFLNWFFHTLFVLIKCTINWSRLIKLS